MNSDINKIIIASLKIALFSFGGGAAATALIQKEYIDKNNFMEMKEFKKLVILANAMPGPTTLQLTTMIAFNVASYRGAIINLLIILFLGPTVLVIALAFLRPYINPETLFKLSLATIPAIVGMLFAFTCSMFKQDKELDYDWRIYYFILIVVFVLLLSKVNVIFIFIGLIALLLIFDIK
ncbi:MAG: chromate transporter [Alphaproteobacteria bacterium]|jgi:chromate transporter|nr:chromate transporter [Alphaproteobacteria bacterium]